LEEVAFVDCYKSWNCHYSICCLNDIFNSASLRELPQKYSEGLAALDSSNWDIAVDKFSSVHSLNPNYEDVDSLLKEASSKKAEFLAKEYYEKGYKSFQSAKELANKGKYSAAIDTARASLGLLEKTGGYPKSKELISETNTFLEFVKQKQKEYDGKQAKLAKERARKQAEEARIRRENAFKKEDNSLLAYTYMEEYVKGRLKSPSSAKFPGIFN